jgi:hypothetical protein
MRGALTVAVVAIGLLVVPSLTSAHKKGYDVFFSTIHTRDVGGTTEISGSIFIEVEPHPKEACIPHRRFQVLEVLPGEDRVLVSGRMSKFGGYRVFIPSAKTERTIGIKLLRKVIKKDRRHLHYCEVQTGTFSLSPPEPPVSIPPEPTPE